MNDTVYLLTWENSDSETMIFSSFEKALAVANRFSEILKNFEVSDAFDEDSLIRHFEYVGERDSTNSDENYWEELSIQPYVINAGLCYLQEQ